MSDEVNLTFPQMDDAALPEQNNGLVDNEQARQWKNNPCREKSLNLLKSSLEKRIPELEDLSHQTEARNNLDHLCRSIEKESWALLDNNDGISTFSKKYNSHIRALVLNISDKSNGDFFRDVLLGKMTPLEIAHLKHTDMASDAKKKQLAYESKKNLSLHVSEAMDVCKIKTTTKPIVKTHKGDFEIEKPPTDESCSDLTSEFVRATLPESYLKQKLSPERVTNPKSSKAAENSISNIINSVKKPLSNATKTKVFPASTVAHTNHEAYSNFDSQIDDAPSNVMLDRQNFFVGSNLATPQFRANFPPPNYQSINVRPQPSFAQNVYPGMFMGRPIMVNPGLPPRAFLQQPIAPPLPGLPFSSLKMRLKEIVAKYAEMRVRANLACKDTSSKPTLAPASPTLAPASPTSPPSSPSSPPPSPSPPPPPPPTSKAQTQEQPKIPELKILSRCHMVHMVPDVKSFNVFFEVLVHNMYGNLAERNIFEDKTWRNHEGMVVEKHVSPDALMSHLEFCLKPNCSEAFLNELAVFTIHPAMPRHSPAYEDLLNSLDALGVLGQLSYKFPTKDNAYERRVYIYALNKHREVHSELKDLLGPALPPRGQRSNMLLGIIALMPNV